MYHSGSLYWNFSNVLKKRLSLLKGKIMITFFFGFYNERGCGK